MPTSTAPKGRVLLAVDQELGERPRLRVSPVRADCIGPVEVGEHEDMEKLGAWSRAESVQALPEAALEFIESHGRRLR
jgi:hypothetical protein